MHRNVIQNYYNLFLLSIKKINLMCQADRILQVMLVHKTWRPIERSKKKYSYCSHLLSTLQVPKL